MEGHIAILDSNERISCSSHEEIGNRASTCSAAIAPSRLFQNSPPAPVISISERAPRDERMGKSRFIPGHSDLFIPGLVAAIPIPPNRSPSLRSLSLCTPTFLQSQKRA